MQAYRGRWQITVIGKDSAWDQRISITGASSGGGIIAGVLGSTQVVDGALWNLTIEHNDGTHGWQENAAVLPDPLQKNGAHLSQVVRSKDVFTPSDTDPNDLVIRVDKIGPMFDITLRPFSIDGQSLLMFADGVFLGVNGMQYMGVEIKNTWGEAFQDELLFDISNVGRATLASFGIMVVDTWTAADLAATQQMVQGRAIRIPPLQIGEKTTVYFLVDASGARRGKPPVEFVLHNLGGDPDPDDTMRHNARTIFIAELDYDPSTGTSVVYIPEGKVSLTLKSLAVDPVALQQLCKNVLKPGSGSNGSRVGDDITRLMRGMHGGNCNPKILRELITLLCRCLVGADCHGNDGGGGGGGGSGGWQRVCLPGGMWLPLAFDYSVEIKGGFVGQHGPLAFQDPWWKIVLLIIALIAWLVGLVESIVADKTGWGNVGDHPRKIGTVGVSNRTTTDACLIELDNSRPFVQQVLDAITGEPNANFIVGTDTLISIDPQVAFPSLAAADVVGKKVYKSGSRTGLTHGIVSSIAPFTQTRGNDSTPDPNHPDLVFQRNQFTIGADPAFGEELFDDHGDSGSLVLSREPATMNQVVGLLHSGNGGTSPIQDVLAALNLKLR
ncbi:hypothetical protein SAMN05216428_102260 [Nitrosospira sp. Nsp11]|uniref:hypothetical protein n=1 Tax=Nitrosospira sp. Nsp11 TaxID=1855338 RepID=UPI000919E0D8|nr:hypothetical protein [Nitrosospira sp. Nsp11]SHL39572.1 hypothetical protein SAMN05216428_102260 [Nitrosospira sp. Nsp11]